MPVSPNGRTPVQSVRRVLRHASILTRQLAFRLGRNPMAAHGLHHFPGVPSSERVGSSLPSVMFAAKSASRRIRRAPRDGPRGGDPPVPLQPPRCTQRAADKPPLRRGIGLAPPDDGVIDDLRAPGRNTALDSARAAVVICMATAQPVDATKAIKRTRWQNGDAPTLVSISFASPNFGLTLQSENGIFHDVF